MHRLTFVGENQMFSGSILKAEVYLSDTYQYGIPSVAFAVSAAVTSTKVRCPSCFNSSPGRSARASEQRRRQLEILLNIRRALYDLPRDLSRKVVSYRGKVVDALLRFAVFAKRIHGETFRRCNYVSVSIIECEVDRSLRRGRNRYSANVAEETNNVVFFFFTL